MTLSQLKTQLFTVLRILQIAIMALVLIAVMVFHPGSSVASHESRRYQEQCAIPSIVMLRDGQGLERGLVAVWNDTTDMYVQFFANESWTLTTTHVHITTPLDTVLISNQKTFMRNQFDAMTDHPQIASYTYTIPLTWPDFTDLIITARGRVTLSGGTSEIAQTSTVWSGKRGNNTRQDYFAYTLKRCTDESSTTTSDPVANEDAAPGVWEKDLYAEAPPAAPAQTVGSSVSDTPNSYTQARLPNTVHAGSQGPSVLADTWLGKEIKVILNASTGVWNHLSFIDAPARVAHDTLTSLQQQIMCLMKDSLNTIKSLLLSPEHPQTWRGMPMLDRAHRMTR
jgi:hypothetical protein